MKVSDFLLSRCRKVQSLFFSLTSRLFVISFSFAVLFAFGSCMSMQLDKYEVPSLELKPKSQVVTFELIEILNKGETYNASPEELKKTEGWLEKALQGGGIPDAKLSKGGENSTLHLKIKIDVYNPPWYRLALGYLNATITVATLGIVPYYSGHIQHIFSVDVSQSGKHVQNYKIDGPGLAIWWGWFAPWLGNPGEVEAQIIESWKLIFRRLSPQLGNIRPNK